MDGVTTFGADDSVQSLTNWWAIAGVDEVVTDVAVDWLARDAKPEPKEAATSVVVKVEPKSTLQATPVAPLADWPSDIATLQTMVSEGALLPGNMFGGKSVAPLGATNSEVMIISDLPDQDEIGAGILGSGKSGALLTAMLAAIGIELKASYWTTLGTTIPATGELPESALPQLSDFVRYQIGLVQPKSVILLGATAASAMLGEPFAEARQSLRHFNHDVRNMAMMTTFHPRTLIMRPAYKAQAWKDLQMFAKRDIA